MHSTAAAARASAAQSAVPAALSRRVALALGGAVLLPRRAAAAEKRGSQRGKGLFIIENDFPYATGRYPPRVLDLEALPEQDANVEVFNAWGKCVQDSCSYVGLKQRYEGYKKGRYAVELASKALDGDLREAAAGEIDFPDECADKFEKALRRCSLLSNALLISENYGTSNEALVARFYLNEAFYGSKTLAAACKQADLAAAAQAWALCRDSWNSFLVLVNRAIVPKVGDKFPLVAAK